MQETALHLLHRSIQFVSATYHPLFLNRLSCPETQQKQQGLPLPTPSGKMRWQSSAGQEHFCAQDDINDVLSRGCCVEQIGIPVQQVLDLLQHCVLLVWRHD